MAEDDPLLTANEAAAVMGWKHGGVWRTRVKEGRAPRADDPDLDRPPGRRMPRWRLSTVVAYRDNRPGQGHRTDLHGTKDKGEDGK